MPNGESAGALDRAVVASAPEGEPKPFFNGLLMDIAAETVVLGGGPAGTLAARWAMHHYDSRLVQIGLDIAGLLAVRTYEGATLNPIPIFAGAPSLLSHFLALDPSVLPHVERRLVSKPRRVSFGSRPAPGSFAHDALRAGDETRSMLSLKQLGPIVLRERLPLLEAKVARKYGLKVPGVELGFRRGRSPYHAPLFAPCTWQRTRPSVGMTVDLRERAVVAPNTRIRFARLIVAERLDRFVTRICGVSPVRLLSRGASFLVLSARQCSLQANCVIYDLDPHSPIYRVFAPLDGFLTVQLSALSQRPSLRVILRQLEGLGIAARQVRVVDVIRLKACYPLDCAPRDAPARLGTHLQKHGVVLFSRFARWEYVDLHELHWEVLSVPPLQDL